MHIQAPASFRGLVLMYHRVTDISCDPWSLCVTPRHFEEHLDVLRRRASPVPLREIAEGAADYSTSPMSIAVTFDDGYADNLQNAKPLLEQYGIPATIFVTTGYIESGREFWWDELERVMLEPGPRPDTLSITIQGTTHQWTFTESGFKNAPAGESDRWRYDMPPPTTRHAAYLSLWEMLRHLSEDERNPLLDRLYEWALLPRVARESHRTMSVREMQKLAGGGLVRIGAHSVTHSLLSTKGTDEQEHEILTSKTRLEAITGYPVTEFAYPYGDHDVATMSIVQRVGFTCACSTRPEVVRFDCDRFSIPRLMIEDWSGTEFATRLELWCTK